MSVAWNMPDITPRTVQVDISHIRFPSLDHTKTCPLDRATGLVCSSSFQRIFECSIYT